MSDSKGFWEGATVAPRGTTQVSGIPKGRTSLSHPLIDGYKSVVAYLRHHYETTHEGTRKRGPRAFYITLCSFEKELGLASSSDTKGKRWACKTCFSFAPAVWTDGPDPDPEDILNEYAAWAAKQGPNSQYETQRTMVLGDERHRQ